MLRLESVWKTYPGTSPFTALADVDLAVEAGEFCALVGPSGSGKSTLLNIMALLDRPSSGCVVLQGREQLLLTRAEAARLRNKLIGFVFQSFHLMPRLSAWRNVALPLVYRGLNMREQKARARAALDLVGLADLAERQPAELSGGQKQRVAIARALVGEPALLLADEPTGSLDSKTAGEIMDLFAHLNAALGLTMIMVSHDLALATRCQRQIELLDGRIIRDTRP